VIAALSAGLAYDVFLTSPYYRVDIEDPDDAVAAITLMVVGAIVGLLSSRHAQSNVRAAVRNVELRHLVEFANATTSILPPAELTQAACAHLVAILNLRDCQWRPRYHGTEAPVLLPDGNVMGFLTELNPDRATLPAVLELPAVTGRTELGRFVLITTDGHVASYEERLTAATIASLFAAAVTRAPHPDPIGDAEPRGS
jgi:K+-sensing histidine kinase KdpD